MKTDNRSKTPTSFFIPIIDFLIQRADCALLANLKISEARHKGEFGTITEGLATRWDPSNDPAVPSLVSLWLCLPHHRKYPKKSIHLPEIGPIVVQSFEEEVLFVLAHEIRHIYQFNSASFKNLPEEFDAEAFAVKMLARYRAYKSKRGPVSYSLGLSSQP